MIWTIDPSHSEIRFSVRHMMISNVRGRFETFTGSFNMDEQKPENSKIDIKIDTSTINTRDVKRDEHLRSMDFFEAKKFPYISYVSKKVKQIDATHGQIIGDLTIRDVTHEVALNVDFNGLAKSPWGTTSAGFSGETRISRKDWGLEWNKALETGGVLVGDEITISTEIELVKQPEAV